MDAWMRWWGPQRILEAGGAAPSSVPAVYRYAREADPGGTHPGWHRRWALAAAVRAHDADAVRVALAWRPGGGSHPCLRSYARRLWRQRWL